MNCKPFQLSRSLLLAGFCFVWALPALAELEDLKLPPASQLRWIAPDLVQNSRDMQIATLDSELSTDAVIGFYENLWQSNAVDGSPGSSVEQLGEWHIVSTLVDGALLMVQQKSAVGLSLATGIQSTGFVSWMSLHGGVPRVHNALPEPGGSTLISRTQSTDFNQSINNLGEHSGSASGTTTMLWNELSVASNYEFYRSVMQERGWKLVADHFDHASAALIFSGEEGTSEIAISEYVVEQRVKTLIVTNQVSKGKFQ